jgi:hypothetical protein
VQCIVCMQACMHVGFVVPCIDSCCSRPLSTACASGVTWWFVAQDQLEHADWAHLHGVLTLADLAG